MGKCLFNEGKYIVLLRHGHRKEIPSGSFGFDAPLTEEGKQAAESLGATLANTPWGEVHASPLIRCQDTAYHFLKGAKKSISIKLSTMLGNPGPFVSNPEQAGPIFLNSLLHDILQRLASCQPIPGMRTLKEGGLLFENYIKTIKAFPCLMFSHDIIIALLHTYFHKTCPNQLPDYLDGFILQMSEKGLIFFENFRKL